MRITGGQAKGRVLSSLKGLKIRPTSDRVREAIFSLIGQNLTGLKALDLFAGTGSLGIEALSRGALSALFVDNSSRSIKLIKKNLTLCGYERSGSTLKKDLTRGLPRKSSLMEKEFDLIFIDPPYGKKVIPSLLAELTEREMLASSSVVITESYKGQTLPSVVGKLQRVDTRTYGETRIGIYHFGDKLWVKK
jgi:16S rRNA (guanine966-N2)-methyltransferase